MAEFRTTGCSRFGHQEFVLHLSDEAKMCPQWLLDYLEHSVASGKRFKPEQTLQVGWMVTKLRDNPKGDLELWEPRFESIPISWVRGINNTVRHLTLQKSVAQLVGAEPQFPSNLQAGTVSPSFCRQAGCFLMTREQAQQNDSGWRFGTQKGDLAKELQSLFQIACSLDRVIPFLALPPESEVLVAPEGITIQWRAKRASSRESKLLHKLLFAPDVLDLPGESS